MVLFSYFPQAEQIKVYKDGNRVAYMPQQTPFQRIVAEWSALCKNAREMPAYGVSLHTETQTAMQSGVWLEFCFDGKKSHNQMPFQNLLVEVNPQFSGFNVVRYTAERGYDGRCFYVNLVDKTMQNIYDYLISL